ncbi:ATPase, AAA family protein [Ophiocordyceps camponoti-floridani]|uniref:ATPase, AAA family protein n=1 Tax=Ophiocordyceps camponoti-floridani TaxID=2030778 RepID=A0A8H4Q9D5_9HYPO|nr:ATPase, AAA family protein [Ophiocordyceps camponoti-floridani]
MARGRVGEALPEDFHPFFAKNARTDGSPAPKAGRKAARADTPVAEDGSAPNSDGKQRKKRRKTDDAISETVPEARKPRRGRKGVLRDAPTSNDIAEQTIFDGLCSSAAGAKVSDCANSSVSMSHDSASQNHVEFKQQTAAPPGSRASEPHGLPQETKKLLKFNPKTGTLGSPPRQKQSPVPSLLVCLQYGHDEESRQTVGAKVTQILDGKAQVPEPPTKDGVTTSVSNIQPAKQNRETKTTHPFFTGKPKPRPLEQTEAVIPTQKPAAPRNSVFMSTPISPRRQRNVHALTSSNNVARFGIKSMGVKVPGSMHPMWPAAGMSHVRGEDLTSVDAKYDLYQPPGRKSKGPVTAIMSQESILTRLLHQLDLKTVHERLPRDDESFEPAPPEVRLPRRRFESGRVLQRWIRPRLTPCSLSVSIPDDSSEDELSAASLPKAHPAVLRHYRSVRTNLSAFDRSTCESQTWTQKYAPTTAAQVLQAAKEMDMLKRWLEALKVQSVDAGNDAAGDRSKAKSAPPRKTRRKRRAKLEGFVVDSDDEAKEMDELSEMEDEETDSTESGPIKRSLIRNGDSKDPSKLRNTIVISGPHGCGKTASVYAVAKELGFEVFEINSSSRRNGKDLLERVGDMTRNHLVQQHRSQPTPASSEADEATGEMKSTPRRLMSSFFKPKSTAKATTSNQQTSQKTKDKSEAPSQKQSLILLEEADVLYEEDKQFWQTLITMMMQSKRPFVVTCSDESLIPLQSLNLHAILRFTPPQASLAVDVCLLMAANEGHALERKAVESLYHSRGNDLRAAISELNYWCQMGIGDRRGGSDWFYPRWPRGSDVDAHGEVIRVVSEGSYLYGIGWIGRDHMLDADGRAAEEDALWQAWDSWQVDLVDSSSWTHVRAATPTKPSSSRSRRRRAMAACDDYCSAMSEADVCAGGAFGTLLEERMDSTVPELPASVRDDFIIGRTLLEVEPMTLTMATTTTTGLAVTMKSLARAALVRARSNKANITTTNPQAIHEQNAISILDQSFRTKVRHLTRQDLSLAFDPIAAPSKVLQAASHLEPSVFDRTLRLIVLDVAPWIRGIMAYEARLMRDRAKLSGLLSQGGSLKRRRTTRAAYSALEGGERRTTRRERYFGSRLVSRVVMRTGAESFCDVMGEEM